MAQTPSSGPVSASRTPRGSQSTASVITIGRSQTISSVQSQSVNSPVYPHSSRRKRRFHHSKPRNSSSTASNPPPLPLPINGIAPILTSVRPSAPNAPLPHSGSVHSILIPPPFAVASYTTSSVSPQSTDGSVVPSHSTHSTEMGEKLMNVRPAKQAAVEQPNSPETHPQIPNPLSAAFSSSTASDGGSGPLAKLFSPYPPTVSHRAGTGSRRASGFRLSATPNTSHAPPPLGPSSGPGSISIAPLPLTAGGNSFVGASSAQSYGGVRPTPRRDSNDGLAATASAGVYAASSPFHPTFTGVEGGKKPSVTVETFPQVMGGAKPCLPPPTASGTLCDTARWSVMCASVPQAPPARGRHFVSVFPRSVSSASPASHAPSVPSAIVPTAAPLITTVPGEGDRRGSACCDSRHMAHFLPLRVISTSPETDGLNSQYTGAATGASDSSSIVNIDPADLRQMDFLSSPVLERTNIMWRTGEKVWLGSAEPPSALADQMRGLPAANSSENDSNPMSLN